MCHKHDTEEVSMDQNCSTQLNCPAMHPDNTPAAPGWGQVLGRWIKLSTNLHKLSMS